MDTIIYSQSKLKMNIDPIKHKKKWLGYRPWYGLEAPPKARVDNMLRLISGQRSQKATFFT